MKDNLTPKKRKEQNALLSEFKKTLEEETDRSGLKEEVLKSTYTHQSENGECEYDGNRPEIVLRQVYKFCKVTKAFFQWHGTQRALAKLLQKEPFKDATLKSADKLMATVKEEMGTVVDCVCDMEKEKYPRPDFSRSDAARFSEVAKGVTKELEQQLESRRKQSQEQGTEEAVDHIPQISNLLQILSAWHSQKKNFTENLSRCDYDDLLGGNLRSQIEDLEAKYRKYFKPSSCNELPEDISQYFNSIRRCMEKETTSLRAQFDKEVDEARDHKLKEEAEKRMKVSPKPTELSEAREGAQASKAGTASTKKKSTDKSGLSSRRSTSNSQATSGPAFNPNL
jgi:hypothetical protein